MREKSALPAKESPRRPSDVLLGAGWIERWLPELGPEELRAYLHLARAASIRTYHDPAELRGIFGDLPDPEIERRLDALERKGLIEVVKRRGKLHFHFRCRGQDGLHRAEPVRPSIKEALEAHKAMMEELVAAASLDETEELRRRFFAKYPALKDEFELARETRDPDMPPWRLWIELSLYLMNRFEEKYGDLKAEHGEVFKDVSAQILRLKLEMLDRLTRDILERREDFFPARGPGWTAGLAESAFVALPLVRELSRKYRVGAEQIYLNTIEALQAEGLCVVELDAQGRATDLILPSTTGLTDEEERLVFLHVEEMTRQEIERFDETLDRIRAAKARYARHLLSSAVDVVIDLARKDRIADLDGFFQLVADRVNQALDLVRDDDEDARVAAPLVTIEDVIDLYNERCRAARAKA
jgi:DNA-binding transcriptional ArsR family regulator